MIMCAATQHDWDFGLKRRGTYELSFFVAVVTWKKIIELWLLAYSNQKKSPPPFFWGWGGVGEGGN